MIGSEESKILFKYVVFFNAITLSPFLTIYIYIYMYMQLHIRTYGKEMFFKLYGQNH